ncbi:MAG: amidohydrolase family protein [Candidatus Nealsonbacteria bacterium]|nr:amidohydrolase family protein [Candidatus Nealsonbacteria bacterium]
MDNTPLDDTTAASKPPLVDAHAHVFCWGERPRDGFLSQRTRRSWLTKLMLWMTGVHKEQGATISEKMRSRLLRHVDQSTLDYVVVLAQDAVYRDDGSRDDPATHFYVSNDYVLDLAKRSSKVLPGCSINPIRRDALAELERVCEAGSRLVKIHTAIQGVDPALARFDAFYRRAAELGVVLMFHTGYEHSCTVQSQDFADPARLERPLGHGGTIIAAHCGTCALYDRGDQYPSFVEMMHRHDNLYGDTAIMAGLIRLRSLRRLSREGSDVTGRILHGSDYPFPPARLPFVFRTGLFPPQRRNTFDMDLRIKQSFQFSPGYACKLLELLGHPAVSR